ncbi:MAG: type II toxin-antitoxin system RelE/ParE family toxin [Gemmatimonadetes bacterium]|nr:type II toxin-antitoxin system RelE/ParE family toxin [Gemmatimonadota bacterium]
MRRLIIRSLAEAEIEQAHLWYAERSPDAARHFLDEIGAVFSRIVENSDQYPQVRSHLRRARMPSFPYGIYFTIVGDIVSVVGVVHARRHPQRWSNKS